MTAILSASLSELPCFSPSAFAQSRHNYATIIRIKPNVSIEVSKT